MATDFSKPVATDSYAGLLSGIQTAINDLARQLEPTLTGTSTNLPNGVIRWNGTNMYWERFYGSSWTALASAYAINISGTAALLAGFTSSSSTSPISSPDLQQQNGIGYVTGVSLYGQNDGALYTQAYSSAWEHQIYGDYRTGQIAVRSKNSGTWQGWRYVLDQSNYNSWVPSLTGGGASGTWGINITGNAGTSGRSTLVICSDGDRLSSTKLPSTSGQSVRFDFVNAAEANGTGIYGGVMTFAPHSGTTASTGDSSYQLGFGNDSGNNASGMPRLSIRNGIDSTWNPWYKLIHSGNVGSFVPNLTGAIVHFARNTAPTGFLKANGAAVSRTTYAALFSAIGTTFGAGDGTTTFNLPDARGEFVRGWDDARGADSGRAFGSSQAAAVESHAHVTDGTLGSNRHVAWYGGGDASFDHWSSVNTSLDAEYVSGSKTGTYGAAAETRPRNIAFLACIKY